MFAGWVSGVPSAGLSPVLWEPDDLCREARHLSASWHSHSWLCASDGLFPPSSSVVAGGGFFFGGPEGGSGLLPLLFAGGGGCGGCRPPPPPGSFALSQKAAAFFVYSAWEGGGR